jgi:hypothetical protein
MPAVALATGRVTLAGQVEGDGPDEREYPGPPGWGLGVRLTTSSRKKNLFVRQKTGITDLTFGTWNVQTMLQPGKMMEIAEKKRDGWMMFLQTLERWE